ncbi:MAG: DUF4097 family beta strand repeat protein [Hungatella hathewayi]|nr:DUF4097 family beta strand repeat protein [Hungatella hathewayi]
MKKFTKVCLIIAAVCMALGIGLTTVAGFSGVRLRDLPVITYRSSWGPWSNWRYWNNWSSDWEDSWDDWEDSWNDWEDDWDDWNEDLQRDLEQIPEEVEADVSDAMEDFQKEMDFYWSEPIQVIESTDYTGVRKLDVDLDVGGVQIIAVDADDENGDLVSSGDIRVKVGDGESVSKYRVTVKDGDKLCIETRWPRNNGFHKQVRGRRIQILVPRGYQFEDVDLKVNAGALMAEEIFAKSLDATMNAGSMQIENGTVEELDGEVNAGSLLYQGSVSREVEGDCRAGTFDLRLQGKKEDYNYEVSASAGAVTIGNDSYASLKTREIKNNGATAKMDLSCMAGSLSVSFTE